MSNTALSLTDINLRNRSRLIYVEYRNKQNLINAGTNPTNNVSPGSTLGYNNWQSSVKTGPAYVTQTELDALFLVL